MTITGTLTNENAFVRKTDQVLRTTVKYSDNSPFAAGTYVFYLTVRKAIPPTSINADTDSGVVISKTLNIVSTGTETTLVADFELSQTDLNIDPRIYFYDIKFNDINNKTTPLLAGVGDFEVLPDSTRRNV